MEKGYWTKNQINAIFKFNNQFCEEEAVKITKKNIKQIQNKQRMQHFRR